MDELKNTECEKLNKKTDFIDLPSLGADYEQPLLTIFDNDDKIKVIPAPPTLEETVAIITQQLLDATRFKPMIPPLSRRQSLINTGRDPEEKDFSKVSDKHKRLSSIMSYPSLSNGSAITVNQIDGLLELTDDIDDIISDLKEAAENYTFTFRDFYDYISNPKLKCDKYGQVFPLENNDLIMFHVYSNKLQVNINEKIIGDKNNNYMPILNIIYYPEDNQVGLVRVSTKGIADYKHILCLNMDDMITLKDPYGIIPNYSKAMSLVLLVLTNYRQKY